MQRTKAIVCLLLLPLLAACDWRTTLGLRKPPPPPLRPGAVAPANADPIVQLQATGVAVQSAAGPVLPTGQQIVFYRYSKGQKCVQGFITYNQNRTVQGGSEGSAACGAPAPVGPVQAGSTGDATLIYGFIDGAEITRIDVLLPGGKTQTSAVREGAFYVVENQPGAPVSPLTIIGFDATGKELYRRTGP